MTKTEKVLYLKNKNPKYTTKEIADMVGCSRRLVRTAVSSSKESKNDDPKILIMDIETAPMEVLVWGLYKQNIPIDNVLKDWSMLSWSAKWLFDDTIMSQSVSGMEAILRKDGSILPKLWKLLDEASIVVGHNLARFDIRKANLRFAINGMTPPMPYRIIDTMKHSMKVFGSASYKLDYLNKIFGNNLKLDAPFRLWKDAINGDDEAIKRMEKYNRFDVTVTEELYLYIRPWIKGHPNYALFIDTDDMICTNCGSCDLDWGGFYYTPAGKYRAFRCDGCGAVGRSRFSDLSKEERRRLLLSVAT